MQCVCFCLSLTTSTGNARTFKRCPPHYLLMLLCLCRCSRPLLAASACSLHCDSGRALIQERGMLWGTNSLAWKPTYTNPTGHDSVFSLYNTKLHMQVCTFVCICACMNACKSVLTCVNACFVVWCVYVHDINVHCISKCDSFCKSVCVCVCVR